VKLADVTIVSRGRPLGNPLKVWLDFRLATFLGAVFLKVLTYTLRVRCEGEGRVRDFTLGDERFILAFYHRRLMVMPTAYPFHRSTPQGEPRGVATLTSLSRDGERAAATWGWFGIHAVRGTASHGGAQALVKLIRAVKDGWDLGIAVDGPRGPRQRVKPGIVAVSRRTGAWIVPVCVAFERAWTLRTWDEMLLPKPFSRVVVKYGEPFKVPEDGDEEAFRLRLEEELDRLEDRERDTFR
jgi:hypothetical protein